MRKHFLAVAVILLFDGYLIHLAESGATGNWHWALFFTSAMMLGTAIYVGLVLSVAAHLAISYVSEAASEMIARIVRKRRLIIEKTSFAE
ncbi:MAG: hypothetical protein R6U92_08100 [Bacillota bacterium]